MSSNSSSHSRHDPVEASSSKSAYGPSPYGDDSDAASDNDQEDLLASDPLGAAPDEPTSNKRKAKTPTLSASFLGSRSPFSPNRTPSPTPRPGSAQAQRQRAKSRRESANPSPGAILSYLNSAAEADGGLQDAKDPSQLDWYVEGPGRRVGYDDLTAIDWIFEYTKERQRLRVLASNAIGFAGNLRLLADNSHTWLILIATGVAVGNIAAAIDVASDWLGDLKTGYCSNVAAGGKFYLNKSFCCWGLDDVEQCSDWRSWSTAMSVQATGGSWILDFLFYFVFSILFACTASFLVVRFSPHAKQSGIPEIKTVLGGFVIRRFMGAWTLVVKSLGLCLAVASGLWLGKEGPLVHVACCCASLFIKLFDSINHNEARKREVLSAAAASGISVAFGSPVGGVLFSLEQLSYYFPDKTMWQSFVCAMIAAFSLQAFNPFRTGQLVLYQVTYHSGWHGFEMIPFAIIGVIGGLYGGLFIKFNLRIAAWRNSPSYPLRGRPVLEVAIVAAITAAVTFPVTFLRAQSSELVSYLLAECKDIVSDPLGLCKSGIANTGVIFLLLVSAVIGFFFASLTFGLQIPAGVLLPSMAIGALYGRVIGLIVEVWQREHPNFVAFASCEPDIPCVTPGTYAIIGAASALAGATRMTVSIVVIMFELTGALTYVLPIMIAVMISKWVGDAMGKRGIYEAWIHFNSYPFLDNRDDAPVPDVPVSQIMTRLDDLVVIGATGHTISSLRALLRSHRFRGFPVVADARDDPLLLGYISRTELAFALELATAPARALLESTPCYFQHQPLMDPTTTLDLRPWMDQTPITLNSRSGFQLTVNMFQRLGLRYIVFADRGLLAGLLTKKDVWFVLDEGEAGAVRDAHAGLAGHGAGGAGTGVLREQNSGEESGLLGRGMGGSGEIDEDEEDGRRSGG